MRWISRRRLEARFEGVPGLARTTAPERLALARHTTEIDVGAGADLVQQGRTANQAILLLTGSARSRGTTPGCWFGPGAVLGDTSPEDALPWVRTIETVGPARLLVQTHREFADLAADAPRLAEELTTRMRLSRLTAAGPIWRSTVEDLLGLEPLGVLAVGSL